MRYTKEQRDFFAKCGRNGKGKTSPKKAKSSAKNGKLGGRPRKENRVTEETNKTFKQ